MTGATPTPTGGATLQPLTSSRRPSCLLRGATVVLEIRLALLRWKKLPQPPPQPGFARAGAAALESRRRRRFWTLRSTARRLVDN